MGTDFNAEITRRRFLGAAAGGAVWVALGSTLGCEPNKVHRVTASRARAGRAWSFRSRPDLRPPAVEVTVRGRDTAPGHIFVAPKNGPEEDGPGQDGAMILDEDGQVVWFRPLHREERDVMDFKVQRYKGEPVLTWWEGRHTGYGQGEYVIADPSYRELTRVRAGNGYRGDHHEFLITSHDTALLTIYNSVRVDLSSEGGPEDGKVLEGIVQEVDIETGEVLFEWHSLEHVGLEESHYEPPENPRLPFDYFHINSVDVDHDSNLLVSGRRTSTVYKIDRESGEVIWRLGGKKSDFEMDPDSRRAYQHDVRRQPDGTITIFDNGVLNVDAQSYGLVLELDMEKMAATRVRRYAHPDKVLSATQGSVQVLPNGNVFIGWGSEPVLSEFGSEGELLFSANFPTETESYRAFRSPWSGQPDDDPAVAAEAGPGEEVTLYASWNGATEVATWEVLAGPSPDALKPVAPAPRKGFETAITLETTEAYFGVQAKSGSGRVLGTSPAVKPRD
jgi:outer membrane protein assembly factor BamB